MPRVLVVEDERMWADAAASELRFAGFEVDIALSYTEAIEKLESRQYDALSLDIMMSIKPGEDINLEEAEHGKRTGIVLYRELRRRWPDVQVVVCSVFGTDEHDRAGIAAAIERGTRILGKPVSVGEYSAAIREAVRPKA